MGVGGGVKINEERKKRRDWSRTKGIYLKDLEKIMMLWEGLRERVTGGGGKKGFAKRKTRLLEEGFMRERKAAFFISDTHLNLAGFNLSVHTVYCSRFVFSLSIYRVHTTLIRKRGKSSPSPTLPIIAECGYDDV